MDYCTTNLPLAAAIIAASKLKLLRIDATLTQATMVFEDPSDLGTALELDFLNGQLMVPASAYNIQLRAMRRQVEIKLSNARKIGGGREQ